MLNIILDMKEKTVCHVSVCHETDILQENINVIISSAKKDKKFCDQLSKKSNGKEEEFEDSYMGSINFVWMLLCQFYESMKMEKACNLEVDTDNVFINYELLIVCIIYFISLVLAILLGVEILLKTYYKNEEEHESQNIPLMEYYQKSSINQKDQNDTAIYLDNQMFNQQIYNNNVLVNSNSNIYNPLDNITPDQSRVRKHDEQLSNQIIQQQQYYNQNKYNQN